MARIMISKIIDESSNPSTRDIIIEIVVTNQNRGYSSMVRTAVFKIVNESSNPSTRDVCK